MGKLQHNIGFCQWQQTQNLEYSRDKNNNKRYHFTVLSADKPEELLVILPRTTAPYTMFYVHICIWLID